MQGKPILKLNSMTNIEVLEVTDKKVTLDINGATHEADTDSVYGWYLENYYEGSLPTTRYEIQRNYNQDVIREESGFDAWNLTQDQWQAYFQEKFDKKELSNLSYHALNKLGPDNISLILKIVA